jgi:2',3'-cyclic-nucleotide 2'-phosphodiesterase / 3'-nucleotidase / 5'-nucleotidase
MKGWFLLIKSFRFKKFASIFTALMLVLSLITPMNALADETKKEKAVSLIAEEQKNETVTEEGTVNLQILATADTHGRFIPYDYAVNEADMQGSLTQILTAVRQFRGQNPNTILVDAGDTVQDNSASLFINDEVNPMMLAMNEIGYDVWTVGNHEFNYGIPALEKIISQFKGKTLCGNVYKKDGSRLAEPYTIIEKAGVKVGIIGMVTPNITRWDSANLKGYKVTNPIDETKAAIAEIKDKVDIIIAVDHMGENNEYGVEGSGVLDVAKACPELTAIVSAHAHSKIPCDYYYDGQVYNKDSATEEVKKNGILIVEPYKWGRALSQINIKLTEKDGKFVVENKAADMSAELHYMSGKYGNPVNFKADTELSEKLEKYNKRAIDDANTVIGNLKCGDLVPAEEVKGIPTAKLQPTAMIELINKVQMHYGKIVSDGHDIDVAAAAAFRDDANIKEGEVKKCGIALIYKFDNSIYTLKMTGAQLKEYMEWSANLFNQFKDGDLTISFNPEVRGYNYDMFYGIDYEIDISKPAGERIVNLTKNGKPVMDEDVLYVAVNNYRANSHLLKAGAIFEEGEKLPEFVGKTDDPSMGLGDGRVRDLIVKYVQEELNGEITPSVTNNWKLTGYSWDEAQRAEAVKLINDGKIEIPRSEDGRTPNVKAVNVDDLLKSKAAKSVDIISINDFHGNVKEDASEHGKNMGMSKVMNAVKQAKAANPNTIVVAGGDNYQGSAMSNLTHGAPVSEMLKEIGTVASSVGNHEFDWGTNWISKWAEDGDFDFLASNIYDKTTGKPVEWAKPYKVVEKGGVKIGFIGLTTPTTEYMTKAEFVANYEFRDLKEATKEWADYLKSGKAPEGKVDVVIALTHVGSLQDYNNGKITGEVLTSGMCEVENLDAVISAHTHRAVSGWVNGVPVVQGYKYGRAMAKLSILLNENDEVVGITTSVDKLYNHKSTLVADEKGNEIYNKYDEELKPITHKVIGHTDKELSHERYGEDPSVLGTLVSDYMRKAANAQIGVTNGGGIRTSIPSGDITLGKLYEVLPFDNFLVSLDLKGSGVKRIIEHGIGNENISTGQFAGLIVEYDMNLPFGERITSIKLEDGSELDMDKYYKVATTDFMLNVDNYAKGGDGYDFTGAKNVSVDKVDMREAVLRGFKGMYDNNNSYVVKLGDTLAKIATKYNVTIKAIVEANAIENAALIFPGDKLTIPGAAVSQNDNTYTVVEGDCLGSIAENFGTIYEKLAENNNIENPYLIFVGQKILIPSR